MSVSFAPTTLGALLGVVQPPLRMTAPAGAAYSPARRVGIEATLEGRAAGGDRQALEALLREHARAIHDVCRFVAGPSDASDATQEALERIVTAIGRFDPARGTFRAWALTVARNVSRDRLRSRGVRKKHFADEAPVDEWTSSEAPTPERVVLARIETERLALALETLPEKMRLAVVLFHVHEASYEEIAETLEVPKGTVMTWLFRGRRKLRDALEHGAKETER